MTERPGEGLNDAGVEVLGNGGADSLPNGDEALASQCAGGVANYGEADAILTGQFARLIRRETGFHIADTVLRYDGLPLTPEYILERC